MKKYDIMGMTCAACSARVEKAAKSVSGVTESSVNLLSNSMTVGGNFSTDEIIKAVENAGYGISEKGTKKEPVDNETDKVKARLISSCVFLVILLYFSMGTMLWNLPVPKLLNNHVSMGLLQLILSAIVMVINQRFFISGFKGLINCAPNMDSLIALGSSAAFIYSTYALFLMIEAQGKGNIKLVMRYMNEFYFESAAMILTLITVGKMLESRSKGKTTNAIKALLALKPKTATVIRDGKELVIDATDLKKGEIFLVYPGQSFPADGVVLDGISAANESMITGESVPIDKSVDDGVIASTTNISGFLKCEATKVGEETTLSQIIKMVEDAAGSKAPIAKLADKVSGIFVPIVIIIAIITFIIWMLLGKTVGFSIARAISVLVISCPCALGLATPVAIMVGSGVGAKNGILFKTAVSLENAGKANIAILDKTGTITKGEPSVTDIFCQGDTEKLLKYAYSIEKKSEHPLAKAIVKIAEEKDVEFFEVSSFQTLPGNGVEAEYGEEKVYGGSLKFIETKVDVSEELKNKINLFSKEGKTPLLFSLDNTLLGVIAVADTIKEDSAQAIQRLKKMGIRVVMLTGDNKETAEAIAKKTGIDEVKAQVLPNEKEAVVKALKKEGHVIMVGDGINDAPALTTSDVGIALGAGTDIAIDSADVVLVNSRLTDVSNAIHLSRKTLKNIRENLFWAFIYNIIGIPLAAGVFISSLGWALNPMFGAAAMSLSSFCVVANALRLNFLNYQKTEVIKEKKTMIKTIKIEGMMCTHCEASVKKTLEALLGVEKAEVSHENKSAIVTLNKDVADETLRASIEKEGYKVLEIK